MVSLAKEMKGEPFHMIASYCQRGEKGAVLKDFKYRGWSEKMKEVSVMYGTGFPKAPVKFVPYYLVFDHTGKLRHNHMAGPWHGGDGDTYQKWVKKLVKEAKDS